MRPRKAQSSAQGKPILIGIMGVTGSGKSNFIKTVTGDQKIIVTVDTPGFGDTKLTDTVVLGMIADWMKQSFDDGQKLHGIVFLHRITDTRVDGGSARSLNLFGKICGENFLKNTVMVTTMWDKRQDPEDFKESEDVERDLLSEHWSEFLKVEIGTEGVPVVKIIEGTEGIKSDWRTEAIELDGGVQSHGRAETIELDGGVQSDGSAMYARSHNSKQNCEEIIRRIVAQAPNIPVLQREVGEEGKEIGETSAGKELDKELAKLQKEHMKAIEELGKMHKEALKASETRTAAMLGKEKKLREEQMAISERDRAELARRVEGEERERKRVEARLREQEEERREVYAKLNRRLREQEEEREKVEAKLNAKLREQEEREKVDAKLREREQEQERREVYARLREHEEERKKAEAKLNAKLREQEEERKNVEARLRERGEEQKRVDAQLRGREQEQERKEIYAKFREQQEEERRRAGREFQRQEQEQREMKERLRKQEQRLEEQNRKLHEQPPPPPYRKGLFTTVGNAAQSVLGRFLHKR